MPSLGARLIHSVLKLSSIVPQRKVIPQAVDLSKHLKISHVSGLAAVRATLNNGNNLDTFSPKAFVLSSTASSVKIASPTDSGPGLTLDQGFLELSLI